MKRAPSSGLEGRVHGVATRLAELYGVELVWTELARGGGRTLLRLTIDRPGGAVSVEDCAEFSRQVGAELELENLFMTPYVLEVSSPGLDRKLHSDRDFERFSGHDVTVVLSSPLDGRRRYHGVLGGMRGSNLA